MFMKVEFLYELIEYQHHCFLELITALEFPFVNFTVQELNVISNIGATV
jgi:hypothetical protein